MTDDDYLDVAQTQELAFAEIRQLKARVAELEAACRECCDAYRHSPGANYRQTAAVAHARQVLEAKHEE